VRLLELCAGASTAAYALHLLIGKDKVSLAGAYDLDIECAKVARAVHGQLAPGHKFGSYEGDVMRTAIESFPYADLLVAGPPCPPFSKLGQRKTFEDSRAAPFWRIIDIIHHQASIGQLKGFLLENVEGIAQKVKGASKTPLQVIKAELLDGLPEGWAVSHELFNTKSFGLPQSRPRVYIVGHDAKAGSIHPVSKFHRTVPLDSLLDITDRSSRFNTSVQRQNIADWKKAYRAAMIDSKYAGQFAIVDRSRTPSGRTTWGGTVHPNICECLTAAGPALHVFSLGCGDVDRLPLDRPLRDWERGILQGFSRGITRSLDGNPAAVRIWGNAMSVPVVGSALGSLLISMIKLKSLGRTLGQPHTNFAASSAEQADADRTSKGSPGSIRSLTSSDINDEVRVYGSPLRLDGDLMTIPWDSMARA